MRHSLLLLLLVSTAALAEPPKKAMPPTAKPAEASAPHGQMPKVDFEHYTVVILALGPKAPKDAKGLPPELLQQHVGYLMKTIKEGKMVQAGPLAEPLDPTWTGLELYKATPEEARKIAEEDPAVKAGQFKVLTMTWMTPKGPPMLCSLLSAGQSRSGPTTHC